jgi:serine phosphatase RsbU (regulator of sigma subunit)
MERLIKQLSIGYRLSLSQLLNNIDKALEEFQKGNQFDDITMLALKREI